MKKKVIGFAIMGFVLFLISFFLPKLEYFRKYRSKYDSAYYKFLNENVIGEIKKVEINDHSISMELTNDTLYLFDSYYNENGNSFLEKADKGDSIIKYKENSFFELKKKNGEVFIFNIINRRSG